MKRRIVLGSRLAAAVVTAVCVVASVLQLPAAGATATTGVLTTAAFGVVDLLDLATYRIHTVRPNNNGTVTDKTVGAVIGVPRAVNVDAAVLSPPDIVVEVLPLPPNLVTIKIARLLGGALPLSVELLFDLPGAANGGVAVGYDARASSAPVSFGTSLTFASTPTTSDIRLDVKVGGGSSPLTLVGDLFTRGDGGARVDPTAVRLSLEPVPSHIGAHVSTDVTANRVTGELTADKASVASLRVDEIKVGRERQVTGVVDRLPTSATVEVISDPDADHDELRYNASSVIGSVTATVVDTEGASQTKLTGTATNVPAAMALTLDTADEVQRAKWSSSGRLGHLSVTAEGFTDGVLDRQARAEVDDLPTALELVRDGQRSFALTADSAVGWIEAGVATGGAVELLAEPFYLNAVQNEDVSSVAGRIVGLSSFTAGLGDPVTVGATVAPGPFHAHLAQPGRTTDVTITDFPAQTSVSFSPTAGVVEYHGSAVVGTIDAEVTSEAPLVGLADHAHVIVTTLPPDLRLDFGPRSSPSTSSSTGTVSVRKVCVPDQTTECPDPIPPGPDPEDPDDPPPPGEFPDLSRKVNVVIDANGATVGSVDVLLNTLPFQPAKPLADDEDGVVFEDLPDRLVLSGRITGLKKAVAEVRTVDLRNFNGFLGTTAHAELHTDAELTDLRKARVALTTGSDHVVATLSDLPADIVVDLRSTEIARPPNPKATQLTYDASSTIGTVTVDADLVAMPNPFHADVTTVPTHFTLCHATDGQCHDGDDTVRRDKGTFLFDATSPVTLNAFLCLTPATGDCDTVGEAASFVLVDNVQLQRVAFEFNLGAFTPEDPLLAAFDTNFTPVTGKVVLAVQDKLRVEVNLPGDLSVAYTGPNIIGRFTGPLRAQDFVLKAFNPPELLDLVDIVREGSFGCADLEFLELQVPGKNIPLKPILCGT